MQNFITLQRQDSNKQWIFRLIDNTYECKQETVLLDNKEWVLCIDKHPGSDKRYLVVFKDPELKTMRDLRAEHLKMLYTMKDQVRKKLGVYEKKLRHFFWFFHYFPSVFQLHLHISSRIQNLNPRIQKLEHVMRNLNTSSTWYQDALILTTRNKMVKSITCYTPVRECEDNKVEGEEPDL